MEEQAEGSENASCEQHYLNDMANAPLRRISLSVLNAREPRKECGIRRELQISPWETCRTKNELWIYM
eukprot:5833431-Pyramimonas_sp.AAC.2